MKTIIHVNQAKLRAKDSKPLIVRTYKGVKYASEVHINGPSKVVFTGHALDCGARAWVETHAEVKIK